MHYVYKEHRKCKENNYFFLNSYIFNLYIKFKDLLLVINMNCFLLLKQLLQMF